MDKIKIVVSDNIFWINGKQYKDCNETEQKFFIDFIENNRDFVSRILYVTPQDVEILK